MEFHWQKLLFHKLYVLKSLEEIFLLTFWQLHSSGVGRFWVVWRFALNFFRIWLEFWVFLSLSFFSKCPKISPGIRSWWWFSAWKYAWIRLKFDWSELDLNLIKFSRVIWKFSLNMPKLGVKMEKNYDFKWVTLKSWRK